MAFYYTSQTLESHLLRIQIKIEYHKSVLKIYLELFSAKYLYSYFFFSTIDVTLRKTVIANLSDLFHKITILMQEKKKFLIFFSSKNPYISI